MHGLRDLLVVDLSSHIAGPYATKLFVDAGAKVIKIESSTGDPLRAWSASGAVLGQPTPPSGDGALFRFLNASKQSVVRDPDDPLVLQLLADADLLVEDLGPNASIDRAELCRAFPHLVILSISAFGLSGPYAKRPATEFTIQAESGSIAGRGVPDQEPFQAGGRITEWVAGTFAAVAALAAVRGAQKTGRGEHVDFSIQEAMTLASTVFLDLMWSLLGDPPISGSAQNVETPSIEPTRDGYVGFNTNTAQQISDFLLMIERADLRESGEYNLAGQRMGDMQRWLEIVHAWTREHSTAEIIEQASLLRIPVAPIGNGETVLQHEQLVAREIYRDCPAKDGAPGFRAPCPPYKIDGERPPEPGPTPKLGEHEEEAVQRAEAAPRAPRAETAAAPLPLTGLRIIDATTWWAGPSATHALACLGADVIHVESTARIDGARSVGGMFAGKHADWWEASNFFLSANSNKRGITLDLSSTQGQELLGKLIADADIFVENFTPRVMDGFGISWKRVQAWNPRCIMVRMPAFGLDGPWRDNVGFAQTMEQLAGLAWLTGHPEDQPRIQRGPCDPLAGMHATFATLVALAERDATGNGHFVECAMVEGALNVAAEQVIEHTAYGRLLARMGNRSPEAAPQGLYPCRGHETMTNPQWLALSVATDAQWRSVLDVLGNPAWSRPFTDATLGERHIAHDEIDKHLRVWFAERDRDEILPDLLAALVPAAALADPRGMRTHPQLTARGFYEEIDHPVVGTAPTATLPYRYASVDRWLCTAAPTLGQHNREVLSALGCTAEEIDLLEADGIIGERPEGV